MSAHHRMPASDPKLSLGLGDMTGRDADKADTLSNVRISQNGTGAFRETSLVEQFA